MLLGKALVSDCRRFLQKERCKGSAGHAECRDRNSACLAGSLSGCSDYTVLLCKTRVQRRGKPGALEGLCNAASAVCAREQAAGCPHGLQHCSTAPTWDKQGLLDRGG